MEIKRYNSNGRFHEAVIHNATVYLSGQVGRKGTTVAEQTSEILENLQKTLQKYGSDKEHILSANVYLSDMIYFNEFNSVWDNWFIEGTQPVRTCVGSALAAPQFLVEISVVAAVRE